MFSEKRGLFLVLKSQCFYINRGSLEPLRFPKGVLLVTGER